MTCPECGGAEVAPPSHDDYRYGCWECGAIWDSEASLYLKQHREEGSMFTVERRFSFCAAHHLPHHEGKCRNPHGHSYVGWLIAQRERLHGYGSSTGMVVDYADLDAALAPILETHLDHKDLNATLGIADTTAEWLAWWIFQRVKPTVPELVAVVIEETPGSRCEYRPSKGEA